MRGSLRYLLIVAALLAGAFFVACGGDSDDDGDNGSDEPSAEQPVDNQDDGDNDDNGDDSDDGTIENVPLPSGAQEVQRLSMSGTEIPFFAPDDSIDADQFGDVTFIAYEVDMSSDDLVDFYEDNQGSWDEAFSLTSDEGGFIVWTRDDGNRAVWIAVSERVDGAPNLIIYEGRASE